MHERRACSTVYISSNALLVSGIEGFVLRRHVILDTPGRERIVDCEQLQRYYDIMITKLKRPLRRRRLKVGAVILFEGY